MEDQSPVEGLHLALSSCDLMIETWENATQKKELTVTAKLYIIDLLGNCCYSNAFKQEGLFTLSHVKYDLN